MKSRCQNCEKIWEEDELYSIFPQIVDLVHRVAPGEEVPVGECPECYSLTHYIKQKYSNIYKSMSVQLTAEQVDYLESLVSENASGSDCVYINLEILLDPDNDFSGMPGETATFDQALIICQEEGVAEIQFYC